MATFGKTDIGAVAFGTWNSRHHACKYTLGEAGTITKVTVYVYTPNNEICYMAIYAHDGVKPTTRLALSDPVMVNASGWVDFSFSTPVTLPAGDYYLTSSQETDLLLVYDAGYANQTWRSFWDPLPPEDPFLYDPAGGLNYAISIYATYTPTVIPPKGTITIHAKLAGI